MAKNQWDFDTLAQAKRGIRYEMQNDIDKLTMAMGLLSEVNATLTEAFLNHIEATEAPARTEISPCSAALKLARSISEIRLVRDGLKHVKEKI